MSRVPCPWRHLHAAPSRLCLLRALLTTLLRIYSMSSRGVCLVSSSCPLVPVVLSHWRFQPITRSLVVITPRAGLCPAVTDHSAPLAPLRPCIIHLIARSRCTYPAPTAFRPAQLPRCLTSFPTCSIFQATSAGMHRALNHCSSLQSRPLLTTVDHIEGIARHQQSPLSPGPKLCQNLGQPSLSRKQPPRAANITSSR